MEIAPAISSPSQLPQILSENIQADDSGGSQGRTAQSPCFGLLFDRRTGIVQGELLQSETGSSDFSQANLKGAFTSELTKGETRINDPFQEPLFKVNNSYSADPFKMTKSAPDGTSGQMPAKPAAESELLAPEKAETSVAGSTVQVISVPKTQVSETRAGLQQNLVEGDNAKVTSDTFGGLRTDGAGNLQIPMGSASPPEVARELPDSEAQGGLPAGAQATGKPRGAGEEFVNTDSGRAPLFSVGNLAGKGNFAASLPGSAGEVQQQNNPQLANNASSMQPGDSLQTAAGSATGYSFKDPSQVPGFPSSPGTLSQAAISKAAESSHDSFPPSGKIGGGNEITMKPGEIAANPAANGDIQVNQDNPSSRTMGMFSDAVDISLQTEVSSWGAEPTNRTQSLTSSEPAGGESHVAQAEADQFGENGVSSAPASIPPVKPQAITDSTTATLGISTDQVKITFTEEPGANRKDQGLSLPLASREGKTADIAATPPALAANPAELRTPGNSSTAPTLPDTANSLGDHIASQIREKLDAGGLGSDNGQITLKLHPEDLGELKINMRMENKHLKVEITAQNPQVKDALMQNLDVLKETLARQNISMDRFDVSANIQQGFQQGGRDGKQMTQDNRVNNGGIQQAEAKEVNPTSNLQYRWQSADSLVNLVL